MYPGVAVSITLSVEQKANGPFAVISGCEGVGYTKVVTVSDQAEPHELVPCTL